MKISHSHRFPNQPFRFVNESSYISGLQVRSKQIKIVYPDLFAEVMQTSHLTRLASIQHFNLIKRSLTRPTGPVLRKLIASGRHEEEVSNFCTILFCSDSSQTTNYLRSTCEFRFASTTTSSSNDGQNSHDEEQKKKNITNLMYLAGAVTGLGAIYTIVCC